MNATETKRGMVGMCVPRWGYRLKGAEMTRQIKEELREEMTYISKYRWRRMKQSNGWANTSKRREKYTGHV